MQEEINEETKDISLLLSSELSGLKNNKVVDYSLELLLLTFRLCNVSSLETSTIENLKEKLVNDILVWSAKLSGSKEYDEKDIVKLRYCLCVFIDESLMKNELFMSSSWANNTLTIRLFDETLGGDNFYDIALSWLNNPAKNKDFLEFIYALLVLGYKGKYSNDKDVKERILYLCNNIASSLSPLLNANEELAFTKAYVKEAKESLIYKITDRDKSDYEDYTLDTEVTHEEAIKMYRVITGACEAGTRHFVENVLAKKKEKYTVKEIIKLTEGKYGNETLKEFMENKNE